MTDCESELQALGADREDVPLLMSAPEQTLQELSCHLGSATSQAPVGQRGNPGRGPKKPALTRTGYLRYAQQRFSTRDQWCLVDRGLGGDGGHIDTRATHCGAICGKPRTHRGGLHASHARTCFAPFRSRLIRAVITGIALALAALAPPVSSDPEAA